MPDTGAPYFIPFLDGTELVRGYPQLSEDLADAIVNALENIPVREKRIAAFTGSGTWTVPAGVTYAIAHMRGGGAGNIGRTSTTAVSGTDGSASSVVFNDGTRSAAGGIAGVNRGSSTIVANFNQAGPNARPNSGQPGGRISRGDTGTESVNVTGSTLTLGSIGEGVQITAGGPVTPGANVTVTVGAGGTGGGANTKGGNGGSGYVYIEYYVEV